MGKGGGAWKLAYSDFTTSMMCFFLVMWIISSRTDEERAMFANYFKEEIPLYQMPDVESFSDANMNAGHYSSDSQDSATEDVSDIILTKINDLASILRKIDNIHINISPQVTRGGLEVSIIEGAGNQPLFYRGEAKLYPAAKRDLRQIFNTIKKHYKGDIEIVGHTDSVPFKNDQYDTKNFDLSLERAMAVRGFAIKEAKIDYKRIVMISGACNNFSLKTSKEKTVNPNDKRITILLMYDRYISGFMNQHLDVFNKIRPVY